MSGAGLAAPKMYQKVYIIQCFRKTAEANAFIVGRITVNVSEMRSGLRCSTVAGADCFHTA
jgi:hypothetical protein